MAKLTDTQKDKGMTRSLFLWQKKCKAPSGRLVRHISFKLKQCPCMFYSKIIPTILMLGLLFSRPWVCRRWLLEPFCFDPPAAPGTRLCSSCYFSPVRLYSCIYIYIWIWIYIYIYILSSTEKQPGSFSLVRFGSK